MGYVGRRDPDLVRAAGLVGEDLAILEPGSGRQERDRDVVIGVNPDRAELRSAVAALRPGGHVYVELAGLPRPPRFRDAALQARAWLTEAGIRDLRTQWHYPSLSACRAIVPLGDRRAFVYALSRRAGSPRERLKAALAARVGPSAAAVAAPTRSVIGRLGGAPEPSGVVAFATRNREHLSLESHGLRGDFSEVLITPVTETSANVVSLLVPRAVGQPVLVAKRPRLGERSGLEREAENLATLSRLWPAAADAAPELVVLDEHEGVPILIETALNGQGLEPDELRRAAETMIPRVGAALTELAAATARAPSPADAWYSRLLQRPLEGFACSVEPEIDTRELVERTLELTGPLRRLRVPLVFEHGDVVHSNVIRLAGEGVGFVDWELAEPRGLPLTDLCFFLGYAAFARDRAATTVERRNALDDAFVRPDGWARGAVVSYAARLGLPGAALTPLFVACWARYAARLPSRLALLSFEREPPAGPPTAPVASALAVLVQWSELWRHVVDRAAALEWPGS